MEDNLGGSMSKDIYTLAKLYSYKFLSKHPKNETQTCVIDLYSLKAHYLEIGFVQGYAEAMKHAIENLRNSKEDL